MGKTRKDLPFIPAVIAISIFLFLTQFLSPEVRIRFLNIFRLPMKAVSGSYYALRRISEFRDTINKNRILEENINNLEREVLRLREAALENRRLKELLNFTEEAASRYLPAQIIARDPTGLGNTVIIDKGTGSGVKKDMVVVSGNGLVGRVRECGWSIARVLLITDRDSTVSAMVQRTRDEGAVTGNGRSGLVLRYIEPTTDIEAGDVVITSGHSSIFKKGIMIGRVVSIKMDSRGLYLNAIVKPSVDLNHLEEVLVMVE